MVGGQQESWEQARHEVWQGGEWEGIYYFLALETLVLAFGLVLVLVPVLGLVLEHGLPFEPELEQPVVESMPAGPTAPAPTEQLVFVRAAAVVAAAAAVVAVVVVVAIFVVVAVVVVAAAAALVLILAAVLVTVADPVDLAGQTVLGLLVVSL